MRRKYHFGPGSGISHEGGLQVVPKEKWGILCELSVSRCCCLKCDWMMIREDGRLTEGSRGKGGTLYATACR